MQLRSKFRAQNAIVLADCLFSYEPSFKLMLGPHRIPLFEGECRVPVLETFADHQSWDLARFFGLETGTA